MENLRTLADTIDFKIADAHRQVAKEFAESLTKEESAKIFKT